MAAEPVQPTPLLGHLDPEVTEMVEDLLRSASARIRTRLVNRTGSNLAMVSVDTEWSPLAPVLARLPSGLGVVACHLDPLGLDAMITIEADLLSRLVGQILGQPTTTQWSGGQDRVPSRFELVVARRIAEDVLGGLSEVLPVEGPRKIVIDDVATSTRIGTAMSRNSFVSATTYELLPPGASTTGRITLILPTSLTRIAAPRRPPRQTEGRMGIGRVLPLPLTVVAELRRVQLPLARLREIHVGQMLDLGPARDVVLRVGDKAALVGEAGIQNAARSVRIKARVEGD